MVQSGKCRFGLVYFKPDLNNEFDVNESLIDSIKRIATNNPKNNDEQAFIDCYQTMFNSTVTLPYHLTTDNSSYSDDSVDENDSQNSEHSTKIQQLNSKLCPGNSQRVMTHFSSDNQSDRMDHSLNQSNNITGNNLNSSCLPDEECSNKFSKSKYFTAIPGIARPSNDMNK